MTDPIIWTQTGIAALQDLLFAAAAGSVLSDTALREVFASSRDTARLRLRGSVKHAMPGAGLPRGRWLALIAIGVLHLAYLWLQAAAMSGSTLLDAFRTLGIVLGQSHYGRTWLISFAGIVIALVGARLGKRAGGPRSGQTAANPRAINRLPIPFVVLGLALYAAGKVGASHAADTGDFSMAEWVHWVHLGATASWAGSVMLAAVMLPAFALATRADSGRHLAFCERLSHAAAIAFTLVIVTGVYNVMQIDAQAPVPLQDAPYGQFLGVKLALAAFALGLGALNRTVWLPRLRHAQRAQFGGNTLPGGYAAAAGSLNRTLAIESFVLAATLSVAAVLGHMPPG